MAKGFRRQGEWQTGYSQRNIASNVKQELQTVKLLEQRIKEETAKREKNRVEQNQENQRQTNNILRVSNYEAQLAANFSSTVRDLLTNTVPSLAKDQIKYQNALGAAARMEEELEVEPVPEPEDGLDPDDPAAGNYGLTEGRGFDAVKAAGDQQLDVTKTGNDLATKLENSNDPFGKEKARKVRGIFSGAYNYGYEVRDKALKVEGFNAHFENQLRTNDTILRDKNGVEFAINDPNLTKGQLALAGNYILGEWVEASKGDLSEISTDALLTKPADKVLKANLKEKFTALDIEFAANQVEGANNLVRNSLDNVPGSADLPTVLNSYVNLVRPHLKATPKSSIGNQAIDNLENLIKDAFARSKDPTALATRLNAALAVKSQTPAGFKSLAELHSNRFSPVSITLLKQAAVTEAHQNEKKYQNAFVESSVKKYIEEQRLLPKEERATLNEKITFVGELIKSNPLATKEVIDQTSRLFVDPVDNYDTINILKGKIIDNGGVLTSNDIVDPSLDIDTVTAYLEANPKIKVLDKLYNDSEKKDVTDVESSFKQFLANTSKAYSIDAYGNVTDSSGTFGIAYTKFLSQIKYEAYQMMEQAEAEGRPMTFGEALRASDVNMRKRFDQFRNDKSSIYYVNPNLRSSGGFQNLLKEQNLYPFLDNNNVKNIIATVKANNLTAEDQITKDIDLDDSGSFVNENTSKISQLFKMPDYDFAKLQSKAFGIEFNTTPPEGLNFLKNISSNSDGKFTLYDLQSKGNTSKKVIDRAFNDFFGLNQVSLTNAWKGMNFESVIRNEVTAQGLELDAGEVQILDGTKYVGHLLVGIPEKGEFGAVREPGKDGTPEGATVVHTGVDIGTSGATGFHTAIKMTNGTVIANASDAKYGIYLDIQNEDGVIYRFAHLKNYNPQLKIGAPYNGEIIGEIGNTGISSREHLHFEKIVDGKQVNPTEDLGLLTIGKRIEPTIGNYPITKRMIARLAGFKNEDNPLNGLRIGKALHKYKNDPQIQKETWDYLNQVSWNAAMKKSNGDPYMAARYHVAYILRGDMDLYNLPTVYAFANKYIHKLRTQNILE
jgi:murein DD-endopeptidase MepM/ murein hydrolase activator NlpD